MTAKKPPKKVSARDIFMPKGIESPQIDANNNKEEEHQKDSNMGKSNHIIPNPGDKRISIYITKENLEFMEKYQSIYRIPKASKISELANKAIEKLRKESKRI